MSLRNKTILAIVLLQIAGLVFIAWSSIHYSTNAYRQELLKRAKVTAEFVASGTQEALLSNNLDAVNKTLQMALKLPDVTAITLNGPRRLEIVNYNPQRAVNEDSITQARARIANKHATIGHVNVTLSDQAMDESLDIIYLHLAGAILFAIAVTALLAWIITTFLMRQIRVLKRAEKRLSDGGLGVQIPVQGKGEIAKTIKAFNMMSRRLKVLQDEHEQTVTDLRLAKEQAESANQLKSQFLALISHEIRTPMNGILGTLALVEESKLNKEQQQYINITQTSARSLLRIIDDILDFSSLEADKLHLSPGDFSIVSLIGSVTELLETKAKEKNLVLTSEIDPNGPTYLIGDEGRLRQILVNLVGNAIKFTEKGKINIKVTSQPTPDDKIALKFAVIDTGIGIEEDTRQNLFTEFYQVDITSERKFLGTGLGLAICKRLVHMMNGEIGVESVYNKGSTFWFTVTLAQGKVLIQPEPESLTINQRLNIGENNNILIVDDSQTNRLIPAVLLRKQGCRVDEACNGVEAVEAAKAKRYDLILMDVAMPIKDGITAAKEIRAQKDLCGSPKIVALTAAVNQQTKDLVAAADMDGFLIKPFEKTVLFTTIANLLGSGQQSLPINKIVDQDKNELKNILNKNTLDKLTNDIGETSLVEILQQFVKETDGRIMRVHDALANKDIKSIKMESHAIRSAAAMFGAEALAHQSNHIECACQQNNFNEIINLSAEAQTYWDKTKQALDDHLGR